jgi:hypothetical protein
LPLELDPAEQVLRAIEKTTGDRGDGCPWYESRDPFVQRVIDAHRHWGKGEFGMRRGGRPAPEVLMRGIEIFDRALQSVQTFDVRNPPHQSPEPLGQPMPSVGFQIQRTPVHAARTRRRGKA